MARSRILVALTLALLASGCVDALRAAVYEPQQAPVTPAAERDAARNESVPVTDREFEHVAATIPGAGGTPLAADVFVPKGIGPVPVVLTISPYFEATKIAAAGNLPRPDTFYGQVFGEFVARGYAVALVDLRGTRESGGCLDLGGNNEQRDAYETVEWLAKQPWSNGRVGMIGGSYDGWTQLMAAAAKPPHLAAIVPIAPVADWYHVVGTGGAKYDAWTPLSPFGYNFGFGMGVYPPPVDDPTSVASPARVNRTPAQPCAVVNQVGSDDPTGEYNAWMKERDLRPKAGGATAPMFYVHGLVDENARPDHIDPWYNAYGGPKRAFLWQMPHTIPTATNTGRGTLWWADVIQWFDYHLMGLQNGVNATYGRVDVQDSLGRWRVESSWPPADAVPRVLALGAQAALAPQSGAASWTEDVTDSGGRLGSASSAPARPGVASRLAFASAPLATELHYAGRPTARLSLSTDRPTTLVVARLYDVLPDGSWVLVNHGAQSLLLRDGLDAPALVTPGAAVGVNVGLQPDDYVFAPGHRVGLVLSSADSGYVLPSGTHATTSVRYDGESSALVLPVVERPPSGLVTWGVDQPLWRGPRAWEVAS